VKSGQNLSEAKESVDSLNAIKGAIAEIETRLHMEAEENSSAEML